MPLCGGVGAPQSAMLGVARWVILYRARSSPMRIATMSRRRVGADITSSSRSDAVVQASSYERTTPGWAGKSRSSACAPTCSGATIARR